MYYAFKCPRAKEHVLGVWQGGMLVGVMSIQMQATQIRDPRRGADLSPNRVERCLDHDTQGWAWRIGQHSCSGDYGKRGTKDCSDHFHKTMKRGLIVRRTSLLDSRHQATSGKPSRSLFNLSLHSIPLTRTPSLPRPTPYAAVPRRSLGPQAIFWLKSFFFAPPSPTAVNTCLYNHHQAD